MDEARVQAHLGELFAALPVGVVVLAPSGHVLFANPEEERLSGRGDLKALAGQELFRETAPYSDAQEAAAHFRRLVAGGDVDERDFRLPSADRRFELRLRLRRIRLGGEVAGLLLVDDNTRYRQAEDALAEALGRAQDDALRDPLTGLFNRRHMEAVLPGELRRAQRYSADLSLLVIDVDHFKSINDRFGHPVGDRVLTELARRLQRILRVGDTCARIGGEEFCVVLPHTSTAKAVLAADRLHRVIRALRFDDQTALRVTASIGVATSPGAGTDDEARLAVQQLFTHADQALYSAKRTGRDRTVVHGTAAE